MSERKEDLAKWDEDDPPAEEGWSAEECRKYNSLSWPDTGRPKEEVEAYVYFVVCEISPGVRHLKIGRSIDPESRLSGMQTGNPAPLKLLGYVRGGAALEKSLHRLFGPLRQGGEWFIYTDDMEALVGCLGFCKTPAPGQAVKSEALRYDTIIEHGNEQIKLIDLIGVKLMSNRPSWK